jgi:hypothetical protein
MTYASAIIIARAREIKARAHDFDGYARGLAALADEVHGAATGDGEAPDDLPEFDFIARLESRITALEHRVAELEARK